MYALKSGPRTGKNYAMELAGATDITSVFKLMLAWGGLDVQDADARDFAEYANSRFISPSKNLFGLARKSNADLKKAFIKQGLVFYEQPEDSLFDYVKIDSAKNLFNFFDYLEGLGDAKVLSPEEVKVELNKSDSLTSFNGTMGHASLLSKYTVNPITVYECWTELVNDKDSDSVSGTVSSSLPKDLVKGIKSEIEKGEECCIKCYTILDPFDHKVSYTVIFEVVEDGVFIDSVSTSAEFIDRREHVAVSGVGLVALEGHCAIVKQYGSFENFGRFSLTPTDDIVQLASKVTAAEPKLKKDIKVRAALRSFVDAYRSDDPLPAIQSYASTLIRFRDQLDKIFAKDSDIKLVIELASKYKAVRKPSKLNFSTEQYAYADSHGSTFTVTKRILDLQLGCDGTILVDSLPSAMFRNEGEGYASLGLSNAVLLFANKNTRKNVIIAYACDEVSGDDPLSKVGNLDGYLSGDLSFSKKSNPKSKAGYFIDPPIFASNRLTGRKIAHTIIAGSKDGGHIVSSLPSHVVPRMVFKYDKDGKLCNVVEVTPSTVSQIYTETPGCFISGIDAEETEFVKEDIFAKYGMIKEESNA